MKGHLILLPLLAAILISCGTTPSFYRYGNLYDWSMQISMQRSIAISPTSDSFIGQQMATAFIERGFTVVDRSQMLSLLNDLNMTEVQVLEPGNISQLHTKGILAYMHVKAVKGNDGRPEFVYCTIASTLDGKIISAAIWANGPVFRVDLHTAATQIVEGMFTAPRE